jgi:L-ascorbate metabolism protein UlaG (beta-lactamase superfamily)
MDINQAASAVREFRPKVVYPYHYSSSDVNRFKQIVGQDVRVEVRLRKWY